jgi:lipopolysaccharide/colanic/teichoic acid biosynthesis glycosyltransferase
MEHQASGLPRVAHGVKIARPSIRRARSRHGEGDGGLALGLRSAVGKTAGESVTHSGPPRPGLRRLRAIRLRWATRLFDVAAVVIALPVLAPIAAIVAVMVLIDSPGPILYRSRRVGYRGREFSMLKFRKMRREAEGLPLTMAEDDRFTPIGKFLALTKLDELPQIWNVIKGDMRVVGPRPELPAFVASHRAAYEEILTVVPGLTGLAQLEFASERHLFHTTPQPEIFYLDHLMPQKIAVDVQYVRSRSLLLDVRIVLKTALLPLWRIVHQGRSKRRTVPMSALGIGGLVVLTFMVAAYVWSTG